MPLSHLTSTPAPVALSVTVVLPASTPVMLRENFSAAAAAESITRESSVFTIPGGDSTTVTVSNAPEGGGGGGGAEAGLETEVATDHDLSDQGSGTKIVI